MLEWKVPLEFEEALTSKQTMQFIEYATNYFGGRNRCYVDISKVKGNKYELFIKIR